MFISFKKLRSENEILLKEKIALEQHLKHLEEIVDDQKQEIRRLRVLLGERED